jgi:hypothetical protein
MRRAHLKCLLGFLFVFACTIPSAAYSAKASPLDTEALCTVRGGQWAGFDRKSNVVCTVGTKKCTDPSQCDGVCVPPPTAKEGAMVMGTCSNPEQVAGLYWTQVVIKGRVTSVSIVP